MQILHMIKMLRQLFCTTQKNLGIQLKIFIPIKNQNAFLNEINGSYLRHLDQLEALIADCTQRLTDLENEHTAKILSTQTLFASFFEDVQRLTQQEIMVQMRAHFKAAQTTSIAANRQSRRECAKLQNFLEKESLRITTGFIYSANKLMKRYK